MMASEEEKRKHDEVLEALSAIWKPRNMPPSERKSNMIAPIPKIVWSPMSWSGAGMQPWNKFANSKTRIDRHSAYQPDQTVPCP